MEPPQGLFAFPNQSQDPAFGGYSYEQPEQSYQSYTMNQQQGSYGGNQGYSMGGQGYGAMDDQGMPSSGLMMPHLELPQPILGSYGQDNAGGMAVDSPFVFFPSTNGAEDAANPAPPSTEYGRAAPQPTTTNQNYGQQQAAPSQNQEYGKAGPDQEAQNVGTASADPKTRAAGLQGKQKRKSKQKGGCC